jgi:hypothetical protein
MADKPTIHEALANVYRELSGGMKKDKTLTEGARYSYLSDDKLTVEVHDAMAKHGVIFGCDDVDVLDVRQGETRNGSATYTTHIKARFRFYGPDGSSIPVVALGEGMDMGDKSYNKAMTAARKYAFRLGLVIGTGEDPDDVASVENTKAAPKPAAQPKPAPAPAMSQALSFLTQQAQKAGYPSLADACTHLGCDPVAVIEANDKDVQKALNELLKITIAKKGEN